MLQGTTKSACSTVSTTTRLPATDQRACRQTIFMRICCTYLLNDDMCVRGLVHKVNGFQDAHRWGIEVIAQVVFHNGVSVQELICRVAQRNDPHMTILQGCSSADCKMTGLQRAQSLPHTVLALRM